MNLPARKLQWRMWMLMSAVAAAMFAVLLATTGFPGFVWLVALAIVVLIGTAVGSWKTPR